LLIWIPFAAVIADLPYEGETGGVRAGRSGLPLAEQVALWYEESREDVYRYLLMLGLRPAQAQETTQEIFLRLFTTLRTKDEEIRSYRAWVFRVAHNLGLKVRQQQAGVEQMDEAVAARLSDPERNPEQALLERERMLNLHRAVENLSEQQRRCLFLRMEGLRYPEIAQVLGISVSAVGEFLRRAIGRLKQFTQNG
jgi:RNA polymerase sigma-70 factor (ECF subfamily)